MNDRARVCEQIFESYGADGLDHLLSMFKVGKRVGDIAVEYGVHRVTVWRWRKLLGISRYEPHPEVLLKLRGWRDHGRQAV